MPRTAQPRYESRDRYAREPYREYPKSIPQYGEDEEKKGLFGLFKKHKNFDDDDFDDEDDDDFDD